MSNVLTIDETNFDQEVAAFDGTVVVDFYADWCGPCRVLAPHVEKLAAEHPDVRVTRVDIDRSPRLAARFGVQSIPTVIRFDGGEPTASTVGALPYPALADTLHIEPAPEAA